MRPAHTKGIALTKKPKGGKCCEKCSHLKFRQVLFKHHAPKVECFCSEAHEKLVAVGCPDFDDVSVDRNG